MKPASLTLAALTALALPLALLLAADAPPATAPTTSPATSTAPAATPKALTDTIASAIKLLEAGKHRELFELLVEPKLLEEIKSGAKFDQIVLQFGEVHGDSSKAANLLATLKKAQAVTPVISEDGKKADYTKAPGAELIGLPAFIMHEDRWYLEGH